MNNLLDYTLEDLQNWMKENNEAKFRAKQIYDWIYKNVWNFDDMRNIPGSLKEKLKVNFNINIPKVVAKRESEKDGTVKNLLEMSDGNVIECVIMKYKYGNSICVSTQVGCRMGCKFCASTLLGLERSLTASEMLSQIYNIQRDMGKRVDNIVIMGIGEPFDNYEQIIKFIHMITDENGLNISQRNITVSTCCLVKKMYDFADEELAVTMAVSLHAPNDEIRKKFRKATQKEIKELEELLPDATWIDVAKL